MSFFSLHFRNRGILKGFLVDFFFVISVIPLNKFSYNDVILLVLLKKIWIFMIFIILLFSFKKINIFIEFVTFESKKYGYFYGFYFKL